MIKYEAKEGFVFDFKKPCYIGEDEKGNLIKHNLNAKVLFLDKDDNIDNYIEVPVCQE